MKPILIVKLPHNIPKIEYVNIQNLLHKTDIARDYHAVFTRTNIDEIDFSILSIKEADKEDIKQIKELLKEINATI